MALLDDKACMIAHAAGWKEPRADEFGVFSFSLDKNISFELLSPDGRQALIRAEVCALPADAREQEDLLRSYAGRQVAVCRSRSSVLALERPEDAPAHNPGNRLILYRMFSMTSTSDRDVTRQVRDFLNDLAWWRKDINVAASPFSFSFAGMSAFSDGFMGGRL